MRLLFVTWDGPATTYHESLFVPLLQRARRDGDEVDLLQFCWGDDERTRRLERLTTREGMGLDVVAVPRGRHVWRLPTTLLRAAWRLRTDVRAGRHDAVMARSIIPGALVSLVRRLARSRFAFVYDADGLVADERAEFGGWRRTGLRYRIFRACERAAVRAADVVVTRTTRANDVLRRRTGCSPEVFAVVVNGKDEQRFAPADAPSRRAARRALDLPEAAPLVVYAGSMGPQYQPAFMLEVLARVQRRVGAARLLLLTPASAHAALAAMAADVAPDRVLLRSAAPEEVPRLLAAGDLGLAFRTPTLSQQAVAPIKVAEYLLCGLPVAYTAGIGDLDEQLGGDVALGVGRHDTAEADRLADWFVDRVLPERDRWRRATREVGLQRFGLSAAATGYRRALDLAAERSR